MHSLNIFEPRTALLFAEDAVVMWDKCICKKLVIEKSEQEFRCVQTCFTIILQEDNF